MTELPEDLADVDRRLRESQPESAPDIVTRAAKRAQGRARRPRSDRGSRLAIIALLAAGFSISGAGAGLAISGIGGDNITAAQDQYDPEPTPTPTVEPSATPTVEPSATPTVEPSATPTTEPNPTATPGGEVEGENEQGGNNGGNNNGDGDDSCSVDASASATNLTLQKDCPDPTEVRGDSESGGSDTSAQVEVGTTLSDDTLPFTGWAALPVLALGLLLLVAGVTLRRRTADA